MLPKFFELIINICSYMNSTVVLYYIKPLSIIQKVKGERTTCIENYTLPQLQNQVSTCSENKNYIYGFCEANIISKSSVTLKCLTTNRLSLDSFSTTCSSDIGLWSFYQDPIFSTYGIYVIYMILGSFIIILALLTNLVIIFSVATSKLIKSPNAVVYAVHMALLDLSLALSAQPMYLFLNTVSQENWFHGYFIVSEKMYNSISDWYNHIDFVLINAQFANLAVLGVERCVAIVKPFWYLENVSYKKCILSLGLVWIYTVIMFFIRFYTVENEMIIYVIISLAYGVPTLIMLSTYAVIIYDVRKSQKRTNSHKNQQLIVTVKLAKLMILFFICWIPFFLCFILEMKTTTNDVIVAMKWTKLLSYCHSFFNPIIYSFSHSEIKKEIIRTLQFFTRSKKKKLKRTISTYDTSPQTRNTSTWTISNSN
ncbi:melanocyte-stimulating hormone receptor [Hydra vulgaris]|uniref:melanocyte-stimulating hormone receptor n=1 Tax=Hydra vulgaris TaxID=6087 RepID=UPI000640F374|nr:melanocyte-stimulating hormone receptor [Hydra vulgaris]